MNIRKTIILFCNEKNIRKLARESKGILSLSTLYNYSQKRIEDGKPYLVEEMLSKIAKVELVYFDGAEEWKGSLSSLLHELLNRRKARGEKVTNYLYECDSKQRLLKTEKFLKEIIGADTYYFEER